MEFTCSELSPVKVLDISCSFVEAVSFVWKETRFATRGVGMALTVRVDGSSVTSGATYVIRGGCTVGRGRFISRQNEIIE